MFERSRGHDHFDPKRDFEKKSDKFMIIYQIYATWMGSVKIADIFFHYEFVANENFTQSYEIH